jgi:hypothetical protein
MHSYSNGSGAAILPPTMQVITGASLASSAQ